MANFMSDYPQNDFVLQQDAFLDLNRTQQLEIIDKLAELGVGDDISLPQVRSIRNPNKS